MRVKRWLEHTQTSQVNKAVGEALMSYAERRELFCSFIVEYGKYVFCGTQLLGANGETVFPMCVVDQDGSSPYRREYVTLQGILPSHAVPEEQRWLPTYLVRYRTHCETIV